MRTRPVLRTVLSVLLLASPGLLVTEASAKPVWTPPAHLDSAGAGSVAVAANDQGDMVAVWSSYRGEGSWLYGAVRPAGGQWSRAALIFQSGFPALARTTAVVDGAGNATVAWLAQDYKPNDCVTCGDSLYVAHGSADGSWGAPQAMSADVASDPALVLHEDGDVTAAWWEQGGPDMTWQEQGQPNNIIKTAERPAQGSWSTPQEAPFKGVTPSIAALPGGGLAMVWGDPGDATSPTGSDVLAATRSSEGEWSTPVTVDASTRMRTTPKVVSGPDGEVTAAWTSCVVTTEGRDSECKVTLATKAPSGTWTSPVTIQSQGPTVRPELAVDGAGTVTAAWLDRGTDRVMASRREAGGAWDTPTPVSSVSTKAFAPDLAADGAGNVVATWMAPTDQQPGVVTAYRPTDGTWQTPVTVHSAVPGGDPYGVPHAAAGPDRFTVVYGADAVWFSDRVDDVTAPTARLVKPSRPAVTGTNVRVAWRAQDDAAGVARVVVRRRAALYNRSFGDWSVWKTTTATAANFAGRPGRTYCFSVKAIDRAGNSSRWSAARCAATPVDDRAAAATAGWRRVRDDRSFRGTETVTWRAGERISLAGVKGRRLYLEATTCPGCGVVTVRLGTRDLGRVSLRSERVRHRRLLALASFDRIRSGRLVIRVASSGTPVRVDGIVVSR